LQFGFEVCKWRAKEAHILIPTEYNAEITVNNVQRRIQKDKTPNQKDKTFDFDDWDKEKYGKKELRRNRRKKSV
jgi:hypothetical protein